MIRNLLLTIFSALLILLFLYAAFSKIFNIEGFAHELHKQPFPEWLQKILLWSVPKAEILVAAVLGIGLFYPRYQSRGFLWSSMLMAVFTGYTGLVLTNTFGHIPCSCGGIIELLNWKQHMAFDGLFFGMAVLGYILSRRPSGKPNTAYRSDSKRRFYGSHI